MSQDLCPLSNKPPSRFLKLLCVGLSFAFLSIPTTVFGGEVTEPCEKLLIPIRYIYEDQGDTQLVTAHRPSQTEDDVTTVALLEFHHNPADNSIYIEIQSVFEDYKGLGIGRNLIKRMLGEFPKTKLIDASLEIDNFDAFLRELKITNNVEEALKGTALYKMLEPLGFTEILLMDSDHPKDYHRRKEVKASFARPD